MGLWDNIDLTSKATRGADSLGTTSLTPFSDLSAFNQMFILSKGLQGISNFLGYRNLAAASEYQASLYDLQAQSEIQSGERQADILREQGDKFLAKQQAIYAKAGVTFSGSAAETYAYTEKKISEDLIYTRLNAAKKAAKYRMGAIQERLAASNAKIQSIQAIGNSILDMGMTYLAVA